MAGFDYPLPAELIAQEPAATREAARLLVVERGETARISHGTIRDLPNCLNPGDLLVANRSRVIRARLRGIRLPGGGEVEVLLLSPLEVARPGLGSTTESRQTWRCLVRPQRRLRLGQALQLGRDRQIQGRIASLEEGVATVELAFRGELGEVLETEGETPLPPYIRRPEGERHFDRERYQTVFARESGSIAAPTAGLHLNDTLLAELARCGVTMETVVLHVGPATFLAGQPGRDPLAVEPERYQVSTGCRGAIEAAKSRGGRVIAVGTTTTRALESAAGAGWPSGEQETSLVIQPGFPFRVIDGLLTNFHLPGSSLLSLVSAFMGEELAKAVYKTAVAERYRFYSYGDAMLIL